MDMFSSEERSRIMSKVKSKDTQPEIKLRKALFKNGLRYRVNYRLIGNPDIVFAGKRIAIFVDGCFWHGCPDCYTAPASNKEYWIAKLNKNKSRDVRVSTQLTEQGWTV